MAVGVGCFGQFQCALYLRFVKCKYFEFGQAENELHAGEWCGAAVLNELMESEAIRGEWLISWIQAERIWRAIAVSSFHFAF